MTVDARAGLVNFSILASLIFVATRQSASKLDSALAAAPKIQFSIFNFQFSIELKFDVNLFLVQDIPQEEIEGDKGKCVGEGCRLWMGDDAVYAIEDGLADAYVSEDDGEDLAGNIEEERVDAEDAEERGPFVLPLDVDDGHQQPLQQGGQTTSHEDVTRTPYPFVERQSVGEEIAQNHHHGTGDEECHHLVFHIPVHLDGLPAEETDEDVRQRRDGAE